MYYYDGRMMCPRGYIMRSGYTTRNDVVVKPTCIKDRGKKGKGPKLIPPLKKGLLTKYGYSSKESTQKRHAALKKAAREYGAGNLVQKLNAIYVLNRNTNPKVAAIFNRDKKWVMRNLEYDGAAHSHKKRKRSKSKRRSKKRSKSKKRKSRRKRSKSKSRKRRSMKQGYTDRKDESIAMRRRKKRSKKQLRDSANESYGKWGSKAVKSGKINRSRSRRRSSKRKSRKRRSPKSMLKYRNLY